MTLTKAHTLKATAEQNGLPRKRSADTIEPLPGIKKFNPASNDDALISGFGKFSPPEKPEVR